MDDNYVIGAFVLLMGVVFSVVALFLWRRHRQETRYITTQGRVVKVDPDSSGEFVTVQYTPAGQLMFGGQPLELRRGVSSGHYKVGEAVTVHHDPQTPTRANLRGAGHLLLMALILGSVGALMFPLAAMELLWVAPLESARNETLAAFISAARARDSVRMNALSIPGAQVAPEFVDAAARSHSHRLGSNNIGFSNDACIELLFDTERGPYYVYMSKPTDWRIVRANASDPYCIEDLDD